MSMLKKELVDKISDNLALHKQDVNVAVDIILDSMAEALAEGRRVELRGFGSFSTRNRKARQTKNPRTGVMMDIGERKTIHFTMSKSLKGVRVDRASVDDHIDMIVEKYFDFEGLGGRCRIVINGDTGVDDRGAEFLEQ